MKIKKNSLITLSDNLEYVVIETIEYNQKEYCYISEIENPSNLKFGYIDNEDLVIVNNSNLIKNLIPFFINKIKEDKHE